MFPFGYSGHVSIFSWSVTSQIRALIWTFIRKLGIYKMWTIGFSSDQWSLDSWFNFVQLLAKQFCRSAFNNVLNIPEPFETPISIVNTIQSISLSRICSASLFIVKSWIRNLLRSLLPFVASKVKIRVLQLHSLLYVIWRDSLLFTTESKGGVRCQSGWASQP